MGIDKGILAAMKDHKDKISGPHFLLSAENPKFPDKNSIKMDHQHILSHLKGAGYDAHEVKNHYGNNSKGIVIYGVKPEQAKELHGLAKNLGQDKSVYSNGKEHELVYHHGPEEGSKVKGKGTQLHKSEPSDYYTSLPGGSLYFTHNFDFNHPIVKSEMGINTPIMPTPTDSKIIFDQAMSPPGAIELLYMKYPDHVVIEKDRKAEDATYLICNEGDIERWIKETEMYGIKVLDIVVGDRSPASRSQDNVQYGVQVPDIQTINNSMLDKAEKIGTGVANSYRKKAMTGGDVLFKVKIKGRSDLTKDIPLHMSLKVFDAKQKMDLEEIKHQVEKLDIKKPNPSALEFRTKIHYSEESDTDYFMLMVDGCPPSYKKFYDAMDGVQYKSYFMHVTIDKPLYDKINEEGLKPEEIEFENLSVEKGAGNTIYEFEDMELEKSFKNAATGAMIAASTMMSQPTAPKPVDKPPKIAQQAPQPPLYNSDKMLRTLASVESSGGKNTHHKPLHSGESAYGKYALTPNIIRETIKMNKDLSKQHQKATILRGPELNKYMQDNPGLEDAIARQHLRRLEHHFGQDPKKIGLAWLEGIRGTNRMLNNKQDINQHWRVKRVMAHYPQGDKK